MGSVFLAERDDDQFRQRVAVKLVPPDLDSEEVVRRFRAERQILASLQHPGIARLLDGGVLVVDEFGWDRFDERTARWYSRHRRDARDPHGPTADEWEDHHRSHGVIGFDALRVALDGHFVTRHFSWEPYLYRYLREFEPDERSAIASGEVAPIAFRYVGISRGAAALNH
jgi:serine/threonine protein kinase